MTNNRTFRDFTDQITDFFRKNGITVDPEPKINLIDRKTDRFDPFVPTGNYDSSSMTVNLYISGRHVKDILRSFAHELIHHSQFLDDPSGFMSFDRTGKIADNAELREYEREAYEKGNILFREWTEEAGI